MSGVERKRTILHVKQKLEILQKLDNGESARTDAEDVQNEGNTISHSAALQSVETLLGKHSPNPTRQQTSRINSLPNLPLKPHFSTRKFHSASSRASKDAAS
ncbi:hypothetical protein AVEN_186141-1 [Araneus ventricosus]|uniref:HTH psq-type domain-containing protein n=1 Tax=Araneus ventricosus TaxID=182803 RepID=A0A4Y2DV38_ARAVE|nr:hypothetical protein AVEN_186141-1 [Araneus ventricosus]